ncbi:MAG: MFS transporter, partial [Candidatus Kariarchaeaceae archaeon]
LLVVMTILSIFTGIYSDSHRENRFKLIYSGIVIMLLGWIFLLIADSYSQLIFTFAFIGIGASTFHPPAMATTTEMFEDDKGKALSMFQSVGMAGNALTPLIFAGFQLITDNWHVTTTIYAITIAVLTIILYVVSKRNGAFGKTDWAPIVERTTDIQKPKESDGSFLFLLTPILLIPLIFMSIRSSFFRTTTLFTSFLYKDYLGLSDEQSLVATSAVLGIASLCVLLGGWMTDNWKARNTILISSIGILIASVGLVYLADYSNMISFTSFYFLLNATYFLGAPATSTLLANRVTPEQRGKLFGALASVGQTLGLITPAIFGYINDNNGLNAAFTFILFLAIIAFVIGYYIFLEERKRLSVIDNSGIVVEKPIILIDN